VITGMDDTRGRRLDCDSHLYITPAQFTDAMGENFAQRYQRLEEATFGPRNVEAMSEGIVVDSDNVWQVKGWDTRGAYDADVRLKTLDIMGVDRQVIFPEGLFASLATSRMPGAADAARHYNDYVIDWAKPAGGRLRPAGILPTSNIDDAIAEARRTIDRGAYSLYLTCGNPPGGVAPSDPVWDPLWAMLAEADVPALLHVGGDAGFIDKAWGRIPGLGTVLEANPFSMATCHIGPQVYLTSMILGGVFERHPTLRFGAIEMTAQWVGPMAEMLDERVDIYVNKLAKVLSLKPSEYLSRQVRVTPYFWEPVDRYIDRFGLEDIYVFSTDFPHPEGGTDPLTEFRERLAPLGPEVLEKFVCTNADVICPA
jgi:predicted TIM-barrel fold metal-dependent hydrolase